MGKDNSNNQSRNVLIFLVAATFLFYFLKIGSFGLYEDDYQFVGLNVGNSFSELIELSKSCLLELPQGRPFAFLFPPIITYFSVQLADNLIFAYLVGAFFCFSNAFMIYIILRKWLSMPSAFIGALFFLLNPADTTKILLTHNLILQPSLFFALLGVIYYFKKNKISFILSYIFGAISLLFYELGILIFLFAPFFERNNRELFWRKLLLHIALIGTIILGISFLRVTNGEPRVSDLLDGSKLVLVLKILSAPFIGVFGSAKAMVYGIYKGIQNVFVIEMISGFTFAFILSSWLVHYFIRQDRKEVLFEQKIPKRMQKILKGLSKYFSLSLDPFLGRAPLLIDVSVYICLVGLIMIPSAYLLSFTHYPPTTISGRGTSVHLAGTIAWGVFIAGLIEFSLTSKIKKVFKISIISGVGIVIMFWTSYAFYLQKGFATVWDGQKQFLAEVLILAPDIDENTILLFDDKVIEYSKTWCFGRNIIGGADWTLPVSFDMYFSEAKSIKRPIAYKPIGKIVWRKSDGKISYYHNGIPSLGKWYDLISENTIMFSMNAEGELLRVTKFSVFNNIDPIKFDKIDGISSAIVGSNISNEHVLECYRVISGVLVFSKTTFVFPENMDVYFKNLKEKSLGKADYAKGTLYNFMSTGKFGYK